MTAPHDQPSRATRRRRRREPDPPPEGVATPRRAPLARLMEWLCRLTVSAFGWAYLAILALEVLARYDPFDIVPKPLIGVSLIVIGLPWTLSSMWFNEGVQYLVAAIAPAINWLILGFLCAWQRLKPTLPRDEP